jgi:uncharacterized protein (TIGR02145 family)
MKVFIRGGVKAEVAAVVGMALIAVLAVAVLVVIGVRWFSGQQQEHAPATRSVSPKTYERGLESVVPITESVSPQDMFTDNRDGQTYKTATIGEQIWMAQNLNYMTDSSWCYKNSVDNCRRYGRLYTWNAAKKACPAGWKLPDTADWNNLGMAVGGIMRRSDGYKIWDGAAKTLKANCGWEDYDDRNGNGTDDYGFSALPGGRHSDGSFNGADREGFWWTMAKGSASSAYYLIISNGNDNMYEYEYDKSSGASVRCVADRP